MADAGAGLEIDMDARFDSASLEPVEAAPGEEPAAAEASGVSPFALPRSEPPAKTPPAADDWDFLGASETAIDEDDDDLFPQAEVAAPRPPVARPTTPAGSDWLSDAAHNTAAAPSSAGSGWAGRLFSGAASLGVIVLMAAGLAGAVRPTGPVPAASAAVEARTVALGLGEAREVTGRFIDNAWVGPLFVVSGVYAPKANPSGPLELSVRWLDAEGALLPAAGVPAGTRLRGDELRELTPAELGARLGDRAPDFIYGSGFMAVAGAIPEGAVDYTLALKRLPAPPPVVSDAEQAGVDAP